MITNNEPRTKLETLPTPLFSLCSRFFAFQRFIVSFLSARVEMEIWFIEGGKDLRRPAPWKIRNTAGGRRGIAVEKRPPPAINWMEFTGTGRDCLHRFWESYSSVRSRKWRKCSSFNHSFLSRASSRVCQCCGENGIKEEMGWVMFVEVFVSCLYILLIIISEERLFLFFLFFFFVSWVMTIFFLWIIISQVNIIYLYSYKWLFIYTSFIVW